MPPFRPFRSPSPLRHPFTFLPPPLCLPSAPLGPLPPPPPIYVPRPFRPPAAPAPLFLPFRLFRSPPLYRPFMSPLPPLYVPPPAPLSLLPSTAHLGSPTLFRTTGPWSSSGQRCELVRLSMKLRKCMHHTSLQLLSFSATWLTMPLWDKLPALRHCYTAQLSQQFGSQCNKLPALRPCYTAQLSQQLGSQCHCETSCQP